MPRTRSRPGRYLKGPKKRKERGPKPRNATEYNDCKAVMKKLLKKPTQENWTKFRDAQVKLFYKNQTMANALMKNVEQRLSGTDLKKFKEIYW